MKLINIDKLIDSCGNDLGDIYINQAAVVCIKEAEFSRELMGERTKCTLVICSGGSSFMTKMPIYECAKKLGFQMGD